MVARSLSGEVAVYPVVETVQIDQVCRRVIVPADVLLLLFGCCCRRWQSNCHAPRRIPPPFRLGNDGPLIHGILAQHSVSGPPIPGRSVEPNVGVHLLELSVLAVVVVVEG